MKAQTAADVLESTVFKNAVQRVEARLQRAYEDTPPSDAAALQAVAYERKALVSILKELRRELRQT